MLTKTTAIAKPEHIDRKWLVMREGLTLSRMATQVAVFCAENKPCFTPHIDTGDYVIIINAEKSVLTEKGRTKKCIIDIPDIRVI